MMLSCTSTRPYLGGWVLVLLWGASRGPLRGVLTGAVSVGTQAASFNSKSFRNIPMWLQTKAAALQQGGVVVGESI